MNKARRKHPAPTERPCKRCGNLFVPPSRSRRDAPYCPGGCYHASDQLREHGRTVRAAQLAAYSSAKAQLKAQGSRLDTADAAELLGVSQENVVTYYVHRGLLHGTRETINGRTIWLFDPDEVRRCGREWVRSDDGRRLRWFKPETALPVFEGHGWLEAKAKRTGLSVQDTTVVEEAKIDRRRRRWFKYRAGPTKGSKRASYHAEWASLAHELDVELDQTYRSELELGLAATKPTDWQVRKAVAQRDWLPHPERWPRDRWPAASGDADSLDPKFLPAAANRVSEGIKSLQTAPNLIFPAD